MFGIGADFNGRRAQEHRADGINGAQKQMFGAK
jgi:hypothetical protein